MTINNYIRRPFAAFFLLLFAFCITPKRFLHDILANHKDAQIAKVVFSEQVTASGFHCHVDDLVVVAPFLPELPPQEPVILSSAPLVFSDPLISLVGRVLPQADGRGPPAVFYA